MCMMPNASSLTEACLILLTARYNTYRLLLVVDMTSISSAIVKLMSSPLYTTATMNFNVLVEVFTVKTFLSLARHRLYSMIRADTYQPNVLTIRADVPAVSHVQEVNISYAIVPQPPILTRLLLKSDNAQPASDNSLPAKPVVQQTLLRSTAVEFSIVLVASHGQVM